MYGWQPTVANFYPRPPRGGRRHPEGLFGVIFSISIHALREEGDASGMYAVCTDTIFLSTPSARRATLFSLPLWSFCTYFYPRPPRGGRHSGLSYSAMISLFLSTPSARRATK